MRCALVLVVLLCVVLLHVVVAFKVPPVPPHERTRQRLLKLVNEVAKAGPAAQQAHKEALRAFSRRYRNVNVNAPPTGGVTVNWTDVSQFITGYLQCTNMPGLAVAVVQNGSVIWSQGFGYANYTSSTEHDPVTPKTLFGIGSTSKAFTSLLVGQLVDHGKLSWQGRVSNYIPGFALSDPAASLLATVTDILGHRTGLPRHDFALFSVNATRQEMVMNARYLSPTASIRQVWQYNNWMVMVAGYMLELIEGTPWEQLVQSRIFTPLGMNNTYPNYHTAQSAPFRAQPLNWNGTTWVPEPWTDNLRFDTPAPAGAINSNVEDMARWMMVHLNNTQNIGNIQLVSPATLSYLHAPHMVVDAIPTLGKDLSELLAGDAYGMNWQVSNYRGHRRVYHNGAVSGFHAEVSLLPDDGVGVVLLTNAVTPGESWETVLSSYIMDAVLGLTPLLDSTAVACNFPCSLFPSVPGCPTTTTTTTTHPTDTSVHSSSRKADAAPSAPFASETLPSPAETTPMVGANLSDFVGTYRHPAYGLLTVDIVSGFLHFSYYDTVVARLRNVAGASDKFYSAYAGFPAMFTFWRNGVLPCPVVGVTVEFSDDAIYQITFTNAQYQTFDFPGYGYTGSDGLTYTTAVAGVPGPVGLPGQPGERGVMGPVGPAGHGLSNGAIVGIAVGTVIGATLLAVASTLLVLRWSARRSASTSFGLSDPLI